MAKDFCGYEKLISDGIELIWLSNSKEFKDICNRNYIIGPPKETHLYSTKELLKLGLIGIYIIKEL